MKKILFISVIFAFILGGCTGVKTTAKGLPNEGFIEFVGNSSYSGGVDVVIDKDIKFNASVNKPHANRPKGKVYAVSPGKHEAEVYYKGNLIYSGQIFLGAQETRQIELP